MHWEYTRESGFNVAAVTKCVIVLWIQLVTTSSGRWTRKTTGQGDSIALTCSKHSLDAEPISSTENTQKHQWNRHTARVQLFRARSIHHGGGRSQNQEELVQGETALDSALMTKAMYRLCHLTKLWFPVFSAHSHVVHIWSVLLAFVCAVKRTRCLRTDQDLVSSVVEQGHDAIMNVFSELLNVRHVVEGTHSPLWLFVECRTSSVFTSSSQLWLPRTSVSGILQLLFLYLPAMSETLSSLGLNSMCDRVEQHQDAPMGSLLFALVSLTTCASYPVPVSVSEYEGRTRLDTTSSSSYHQPS